MNNVYFCIFVLIILMRPNAVLAIDYNNIESFCETLMELELEEIEADLTAEYITEAEAKIETQETLDNEQCVCFFQAMQDLTGAEYTLLVQKMSIEAFTPVEISKMEEQGLLALPNNLDEDTLMEEITAACGIEVE